MNASEQEAILTLSLMAGFADGTKNDAERAEFKRIAETLPRDVFKPAALYQRVLLKQVTLPQVTAALPERELRQLAYEMAVCVCDADGAQTDAERAFLGELRRALQLDEPTTSKFERSADALAVEPLADTAPLPVAMGAAATTADAAVDKMVLNYAILNGALELLPQSLATMAIVPLQMKMVYRVGRQYGHELSRSHITELLAAAGLGLTSQVLEGYARKVLGGLLGKAGGGLFGKKGGGLARNVGQSAAGSVMSFATTWALGKLAKQYYSGGRKLSAIELRQMFGSLTEQARALHSQHAGAIRDKAGSVNLGQLLPLIRGQV